MDDAADVVVEQLNEGIDQVQASLSYTLGANVEDLTLTGTGNFQGIGNSLNNTITGNQGDNRLYGGEGNDLLRDYSGGDDLLEGGAGNDQLEGNNGNDRLDGGVGEDVMAGGRGDDQYYVDNTNDRIVEAMHSYDTIYYTKNTPAGPILVAEQVRVSEGNDTVESTATYTLPNAVENLLLKGNEAIDGAGNVMINNIEGNAAANTLYAYRLNGEADNLQDSPVNFTVTPRQGTTERLLDYTLYGVYKGEIDPDRLGFTQLRPAQGDTLTGNGGDDRLVESLNCCKLVGE